MRDLLADNKLSCHPVGIFLGADMIPAKKNISPWQNDIMKSLLQVLNSLSALASKSHRIAITIIANLKDRPTGGAK